MRLLGQPLLGRSTPDGYPLQGSYWLSSGQLAQRIELAQELVAHAHRLTTPAPLLPPFVLPAKAPNRFELPDLRTLPSAKRWLEKQADGMAPTPGTPGTPAGDSAGAAAAGASASQWSLYLASPEFMYRAGI